MSFLYVRLLQPHAMLFERSHKEHLELLRVEASADDNIALQSQEAKGRFEVSKNSTAVNTHPHKNKAKFSLHTYMDEAPKRNRV